MTTATLLLIALTWLPALLGAFVVVGQGLKAFGVEFTSAGFAALLEGFEPDGTVVHTSPQQESETHETVDTRAAETDFGARFQREAGYEAEEEREEEEEEEDLEGPGWTRERQWIYETNRNLFLSHRIRPSELPNQLFDVSIFLVGAHEQRPTDIVEKAEFFLGRAWGNRVFEVRNSGEGETIGMSTAAYGPALCVCRVVLRDGAEVLLHRFLDFEMSWAFPKEQLDVASTA